MVWLIVLRQPPVSGILTVTRLYAVSLTFLLSASRSLTSYLEVSKEKTYCLVNSKKWLIQNEIFFKVLTSILESNLGKDYFFRYWKVGGFHEDWTEPASQIKKEL